jgi:AcrR family transcriptional regulator
MRHPDGTALFDWDFYNITETANFMLTEQERGNSHLMIGREPIMSDVNTAILNAAEARMRLGGFNGFSFRDIAADVGVKSSSVHYHFPTKETLAAAVIHRYTDSDVGTTALHYLDKRSGTTTGLGVLLSTSADDGYG